MATSEVQICNHALMRLGLKPITTLNENNDRALACRTIYDDTRDQVLLDGNWSFARKRETLSPENSSPEFGYAYQFVLPQDCIKVLATDDDSEAWTVEDGRLLSDRDSLKILYLRRVTDVTKYSAAFVDALAEKLAAELALPLKADLREKDYHTKLYFQKLQNARTRDAQQGTPDEVEQPDDLIVIR